MIICLLSITILLRDYKSQKYGQSKNNIDSLKGVYDIVLKINLTIEFIFEHKY